MSRIAQTFSQLSAQGRRGLTPFITAGDPYPEMTVDLMHALVKSNSNVIEPGVPFSDPMVDGPVIQRMSERASAKEVSLRIVLEYVRTFHTTNSTTPMVLMGYTNPVGRMGVGAFAKAASEADMDGVLVVSYPPEKCETFAKTMCAADIDPIFLLVPMSTEARIAQITHVVSDYICYVSLRGVTGAATIDLNAVAARVPQTHQHTRLPAGVGFGIRGAATARTISGVADAAVTGSRVVQLLGKAPHEQAVQYLTDFIAEIRRALDT